MKSKLTTKMVADSNADWDSKKAGGPGVAAVTKMEPLKQKAVGMGVAAPVVHRTAAERAANRLTQTGAKNPLTNPSKRLTAHMAAESNADWERREKGLPSKPTQPINIKTDSHGRVQNVGVSNWQKRRNFKKTGGY